MYCTKCGKAIKDGKNFCSSCGTKLNSTSSENTQVSSKRNEQKNIKCGNCGHIGSGESARQPASIILAWLGFFITPIVTLLYYALTYKYRCPKCHSTFIGIKNKEGAFVSQKRMGGLGVVVVIIVAIAIIGLLSTLAVVALNNARMKARDARRFSDIKQIQTAAELYYNDTGKYPQEITPGQKIEYNGVVYMSSTPTNPMPNDGDCPTNFEYKYSPSIDGLSYELDYCLGGNTGGVTAGLNTAWPQGLTKDQSNLINVNENIPIEARMIDIGKNPDYLINKNFKANKVTLFGIKIGDDESAIPKDLIESRSDDVGWIHLTNGSGYRVVNKKVVEMAIHEKIFNKLGIIRRDEIEFRFGKPDKIEDDSILNLTGYVYYYYDRGLIVRWLDNSISLINIIGNN